VNIPLKENRKCSHKRRPNIFGKFIFHFFVAKEQEKNLSRKMMCIRKKKEDIGLLINCQKSFAPTICEECMIKEFQYA
jgi:hypothetical protein